MTATKTVKAAAAKAEDAPEHLSLDTALAAFQAELPRVGKDSTAQVRSEKGSYSYRYADLSEISPIVLPLLARHGMSWSTRPTFIGEGLFSGEPRFVLHYRLAHTSGDCIEGHYPLPAAGSSPQVLGSYITYARRYALLAVTGVAPGGDDDDAAAATAAAAQRDTRARPQPAQPAQQTPAASLPAQAADAARRQLHAAALQNGWSVAKVAALYSKEHDGADLRNGSAQDVEAFRKSLFSRSDQELVDERKESA